MQQHGGSWLFRCGTYLALSACELQHEVAVGVLVALWRAMSAAAGFPGVAHVTFFDTIISM
jgi:hypothetical protein